MTCGPQPCGASWVSVWGSDQVHCPSSVRVLLSCRIAGLEPMDPLLATDSRGNVGPGYCGSSSMFAYYFQRWCYPSFRSPQVLKDRVLWSAPGLNPGTHTLTFNALAVTRGVGTDDDCLPVNLPVNLPGVPALALL